MARRFHQVAAAIVWWGAATAALAQAPPPVPPIADVNRTQSYTISSSTPQIQVGFPVFGDCTDLQVTIGGVVTPYLPGIGSWNCASASGSKLSNLPLPIIDMVVNFTPPLTSGTLTIAGAWHSRNLTVPTAPGINRREFEQALSGLTAGQRELYAKIGALYAVGNVPTIADQAAHTFYRGPATGVGQGFPFFGPLNPLDFPPSVPLGNCPLATQLGFVGDGVTDNATSYAAFATSGGTCLQFPAGVFYSSAPYSETFPASTTVTIAGAGQDVTELTFAASVDGLDITFTGGDFVSGSSLQLSGLSITTQGTPGGNAVLINGASGSLASLPKTTAIHDVTFRGHNHSEYWNVDLNLQSIEAVMVHNATFYGPNGVFNQGTGILFNGTMLAQSLILDVSKSNFTFLNYGVHGTGTYQGITVATSTMEGVATGVACGDGSAQESQCIVTGNSIEAAVNNIYANRPGGLIATGNLLIGGVRASSLSTNYAVELSSAAGSVVNGNVVFMTNAGSGQFPSCIDLSAGDGSPGSSFVGNVFTGCTTTEKYSASLSMNVASIGNAINGTPSYVNLPAFGSGNVLLDAGAGDGIWNARFDAELFRVTGAAPSISSCGGGTPGRSATSTSQFGTFTTGTGAPTSCTLTFANPQWAVAAACVAQSTAGPPIATGTVTVGFPSTVLWSFSAGATSTTFNYVCNGN